MSRQPAEGANPVILIERIYSKYPLVDNFETFEWPKREMLEALYTR